MPEYIELKLNANIINEHYSIIYSRVINFNTKSGGEDIVTPTTSFRVKAFARGKELILSLHDDSMARCMWYKFHLGMSGMFYLSPVPPENLGSIYKKNTLFAFESLDKQSYLCFMDVRRFAKWEFTSAWGKNRGPDPLIEENDFRDNIKANINSKDFKKPIYEVLTNQKYFNGIGIYLLSKILDRVGDDPNLDAKTFIIKNKEKFFSVINEVLNEDIQYFKNEQEYYYPYQQGNYLIMKNGRKFWYGEKLKKYF